MTDSNWVNIVLTQGRMIKSINNIELYELDGQKYKFDTFKGTMRKVKKGLM